LFARENVLPTGPDAILAAAHHAGQSPS